MLVSNPTDLGTVYPPTSDTYTTQPQKPRPPLLTQEASPRELRRAQSCEAVFAAGESANSQASREFFGLATLPETKSKCLLKIY